MTQQNITPMTPDLARLRALAETLPHEMRLRPGYYGTSDAAIELAEALPALLAELETARAQVAAMREALDEGLEIVEAWAAHETLPASDVRWRNKVIALLSPAAGDAP